MKLNWNFWRGGELQMKKTICGGGMDILGNHTLSFGNEVEY